VIGRAECVEFENVVCTASTAQAILVLVEGRKVWIPQSQIHDDSEVYGVDHRGTLIVSEWIAIEKRLV